MTAQILALIIFLAMFVLIILEVWDRHLITLGCGLLTLVLVFGLGMRSMSAVWETLNVKSIFTTAFWYAAGESSEASSGINWQTIIFIAGMMIMVEGMARVGFFRWLCMRLAKLVKYQVIPIFMTFMVLSFVLAMFIDSITVILFLAAVLFQVVTLPVEFNASARAIRLLDSCGILGQQEIGGTKKVLTAAALTYVASLAASILQLLRLLILAGGRRRND